VRNSSHKQDTGKKNLVFKLGRERFRFCVYFMAYTFQKGKFNVDIFK